MADSSKGRVTITLGRSGQVVKRAATVSDCDGQSGSVGGGAAGSKRSVMDRLGDGGALDACSSHVTQFDNNNNNNNNKRHRGDSVLTSLSSNGFGDTRINKDDLRFKLMQKNDFRRAQSDDDGHKTMDLREKLSRPGLPQGPPVRDFDTRHCMPEPKHAGFVGRIPPTRRVDDLPDLELSRNSYSAWTLDHIRRRSPDRGRERSPGRMIRRSPGRLIGRSPDRMMRRSLDRLMGRSPDRMMRRSPDRIMRRSPSRMMRRSPRRMVRRSPDRMMRRSLDRMFRRSPDRMIRRSPDRMIRRSPDRMIRRSPDRMIRSPRGLSPRRNIEEIQTRPLNRAFDVRAVPYANKDVLDASGSISSSPAFMTKSPLPPISAKPPVPFLSQLPPPSGLAQKSPYVGEEPQTVEGFLNSLGLGKYAHTFLAEEVDMTALKQMGENDLKEMGVPMGPRKKILLALLPRSKMQP